MNFKKVFSNVERGVFATLLCVDPVSAAISAGGAILSTVFGGLFGQDSQKKNWNYRQKEMKLQDQYNRQYMDLQQQYNQDNMRYGYQLENEYNSPSAQVKKMESAGLNPYYNEQGAVVAQSSPGSVSAGLPSSPSGSFNYQNPWAAFSNLPSDIAQIATAFKSLQEAEKVGVDTSQIKELFAPYLEKAKEDARAVKLLNDYQDVVTKWYSEHGNSYLSHQDRLLLEQIGELAMKGSLEKAQALVEDKRRIELENKNSIWNEIKDFIIREHKARTEQAEEAVHTQEAMTDTTRKQGIAAIMQGQAALRSADANFMLSKAQTITENRLRDLRASALDISNQINQSENIFKQQTLVNRINGFVDEMERQGLLNKNIKEQIRYALYTNDTRLVRDLFDSYTRILSIGGDAAKAFLK